MHEWWVAEESNLLGIHSTSIMARRFTDARGEHNPRNKRAGITTALGGMMSVLVVISVIISK